jgi:hypothetical protein
VIEVAATDPDELVELVRNHVEGRGHGARCGSQRLHDTGILSVETNSESRLELALDHSRSVRLKHPTGSKAAEEDLAHGVLINTRLPGEGKGLGHSLDVGPDDELVACFRNLARPGLPDMDDRLPEVPKDWLGVSELALGTTDHDRKCPVDCSSFASADGGIEHRDASLSQFLGDLSRGGRID